MIRPDKWHVGLLCLTLGGISLCRVVPAAYAQATDPAQLEALAHVQDGQDQRRVALEAAQQQAAQQAQQQERRLQAQASANAARIAAARNAQNEADWQDDRRYKEASRELELKEQQLKLKMLEARASREDDLIKAELAHKQAETDSLLQSSQGDAKLKADVGEATKMSQRHWWEGN
ncbi:hypothetical protein AL01_08925 [Bombella intestini]|uniref:Uncharacterized protein n=1 Tax=Bombella intestini TaxID=1539051 RepID=A0A1S8GN25_9PROT|nr:DUF5384 family protein [Bombella intestini]OOL17025.1 hypothetical protein AL01_08925 [Bombella intestini]